MRLFPRWTPLQQAAIARALSVVSSLAPATARDMRAVEAAGRLRPMPPWLRRVLNGAIGFAIPVFDVVFVWPAECDDLVSLCALLVHEHRHLQDGWRAWLYAAWSIWSTRLREHAAYAEEMAFLERWRATLSDPALVASLDARVAWLRRVLVSLERRGRLP